MRSKIFKLKNGVEFEFFAQGEEDFIIDHLEFDGEKLTINKMSLKAFQQSKTEAKARAKAQAKQAKKRQKQARKKARGHK